MRSYTAINITFITLTSTIATSITRMKSVIRSIIFAMLAKGERPSHVWTSSTGLPSLFLSSPSAVSSAALTFASRAGSARRTAISMASGEAMRSSSRASAIWM